MMKKGEKDRGSEKKESVYKNSQGFCKSSINPPASFLCFGTQIYHTLSTECWVGFRAKQAPLMDVGKVEAKNETE